MGCGGQVVRVAGGGPPSAGLLSKYRHSRQHNYALRARALVWGSHHPNQSSPRVGGGRSAAEEGGQKADQAKLDGADGAADSISSMPVEVASSFSYGLFSESFAHHTHSRARQI